MVGALKQATPPALKVSDVTFTTAGRKVTAVIHLDGGTLAAQGLVTKDDRINLGNATVAMWQGGIVTKVGPRQGSGLKIAFAPQPGRLIVTAAANKGAFTHLAVNLAPDRRSVALVFTKAAAPRSPPPPPCPRPSPRLRLRRPCPRLRLHRPCLRRRRPPPTTPTIG